jgi:nucleoside-triphosphatase
VARVSHVGEASGKRLELRVPKKSSIIVVTGATGCGKTRLCLDLLHRAQEAGYSVSGLISPAYFFGGAKQGIDVLDVSTGERRRLATVDPLPEGAAPGLLRTQRYRFIPEAMAWGENVLRSAPPTDLFFIDELGPLELVRGEGWQVALDRLRSPLLRLAVAVVRPSLLEAFEQALPGVSIIRWETGADLPVDPLKRWLAD